MDLYPLTNTGIALKFSGRVLVLNPPEKIKKALRPSVIVTTYPIPADTQSGMFPAEEDQKLFTGAGEYEKDAIHIRGYGAATTLDDRSVQTTSWLVESDGIRTFIPGAVQNKKDLQPALSDAMQVDILVYFCNSADGNRLDVSDVGHVAAVLQAQWVVLIGDDESMKKHITKDLGNEERAEGKFTVKKKDIREGGGVTAVHII